MDSMTSERAACVAQFWHEDALLPCPEYADRKLILWADRDRTAQREVLLCAPHCESIAADARARDEYVTDVAVSTGQWTLFWAMLGIVWVGVFLTNPAQATEYLMDVVGPVVQTLTYIVSTVITLVVESVKLLFGF